MTPSDPHEPGVKHDDEKTMAGVLGDFSRALNAVAEVGTFGAKKYTRGGWRTVPYGKTRYTDAMWRHLLGESVEALDPESKLLHAAHLAWNALSRLELILADTESLSLSPGVPTLTDNVVDHETIKICGICLQRECVCVQKVKPQPDPHACKVCHWANCQCPDKKSKEKKVCKVCKQQVSRLRPSGKCMKCDD